MDITNEVAVAFVVDKIQVNTTSNHNSLLSMLDKGSYVTGLTLLQHSLT